MFVIFFDFYEFSSKTFQWWAEGEGKHGVRACRRQKETVIQLVLTPCFPSWSKEGKKKPELVWERGKLRKFCLVGFLPVNQRFFFCLFLFGTFYIKFWPGLFLWGMFSLTFSQEENATGLELTYLCRFLIWLHWVSAAAVVVNQRRLSVYVSVFGARVKDNLH